MEFLGLGLPEIVMIIVIAMIIFGPGRIVEIATMLGKAARNFRRITSELTTTITREIELEENEKKRAAQLPAGTENNAAKPPDAGASQIINSTDSFSKETTDPRD